MLSIEEVKQNLITSDIKLVSYSSTITMMHGPIYIKNQVSLEKYTKEVDFLICILSLALVGE